MTVFFNWLRKGAEAIGALLMLALFATFLLQIFSRYAMNAPFGWTLELCLLLWVWIVFFGAAFIVRRTDHITFDLLYMAVPKGPRRVMAIVSSLSIAVLLIWSFLPTWDWIDFLRIKRSATLRIPMRDIFSVYMIFLVAVIAACLWRTVTLLRRGLDEDEPANDPSHLRLTTMRSHDQYNTTIYGMDDRYRGVFGRRDVIFINEKDMQAIGIADGDLIDVASVWRGDDRERVVKAYTAVAYDIPQGSIAGYYPEMNVLVALGDHDPKSGTPAYKGVPVRVIPSVGA